jgi:anti-sigma factor RsiW
MTCRELADFLTEYLDGSLPAPLRSAFEAHLANCPECVRYLRSFEMSVALCRSAREPLVEEAPPELIEAIIDASRSDKKPR